MPTVTSMDTLTEGYAQWSPSMDGQWMARQWWNEPWSTLRETLVKELCMCVYKQYPYPTHIHTYLTPTHPRPPLAAGGLAIHSFSSLEQPFFLSTRRVWTASCSVLCHTINTQSAHSLTVTGSCSQHMCTSLKSHMGTVATLPGKAQATREFP